VYALKQRVTENGFCTRAKTAVSKDAVVSPALRARNGHHREGLLAVSSWHSSSRALRDRLHVDRRGANNLVSPLYLRAVWGCAYQDALSVRVRPDRQPCPQEPILTAQVSSIACRLPEVAV